jgi:ABC-type transporter Mla MlaB component
MNSKLLALGAQERFQGEREKKTNQVSRSQIGKIDVASLALFDP